MNITATSGILCTMNIIAREFTPWHYLEHRLENLICETGSTENRTRDLIISTKVTKIVQNYSCLIKSRFLIK